MTGKCVAPKAFITSRVIIANPVLRIIKIHVTVAKDHHRNQRAPEAKRVDWGKSLYSFTRPICAIFSVILTFELKVN